MAASRKPTAKPAKRRPRSPAVAAAPAAPTAKGQRRPRPGDLKVILGMIAEGDTLTSACRKLGISAPDASRALTVESLDSGEAYAIAKECLAMTYADAAMSVAQKVARKELKPDQGRLILDVYKWIVSVVSPKNRDAIAVGIENTVAVQNVVEADKDSSSADDIFDLVASRLGRFDALSAGGLGEDGALGVDRAA